MWPCPSLPIGGGGRATYQTALAANQRGGGEGTSDEQLLQLISTQPEVWGGPAAINLRIWHLPMKSSGHFFELGRSLFINHFYYCRVLGPAENGALLCWRWY